MTTIGSMPTQIVDPQTGNVTAAAQSWFNLVATQINTNAVTQAPSTSNYIVTTADSNLSNAVPLANFATGFLKSQAGTGSISTQASIHSSDLDNTNVSPGMYGDSLNVPIITVNSKGQLTNVHVTPVNSTFAAIDFVSYTYFGGF